MKLKIKQTIIYNGFAIAGFCILMNACTNNSDFTVKKTEDKIFLKDTIDELKIKYKYNEIVFDSAMKPLTAIVKNQFGIIGEFIDGKRIGIHRSYFKNGLTAWEGEYSNGLAHGYWKCFDEKGEIKYETNFVKGTGMDITINDRGDTLYIGKYENGKLNGDLKRYYDNGELMYTKLFKNGTGVDKRYHQNKNLAFERPLIDGKENGTYKEYYENGKLRRTIEFKNGIPDGEIIYWDEFGNELSRTKYKGGIILTSCQSKQSRTQNGEKTRSEYKLQLTEKSSRDYIDEIEQLEVTLGKQIWMTRNLNVDKFKNGDLISQAKTPAEWEKANDEKQPAWCYYMNDSTLSIYYGKLYNYYAINDARGLAPEGWAIPDESDWLELTNFLGDEDEIVCKKLKTKTGWGYTKGNGNNESNFSALPGGYRKNDGTFGYFGLNGFWWSTNTSTYENTRQVYLTIAMADIFAIGDGFYGHKGCGLSVRCLKND